MKDTLVYLLEKIVEHPQDVDVVEQLHADKTILTIHANQADIGKIIGKSGRIIKALRDLIKLMATKEHTYVDVVIAESVPTAPIVPLAL